MRAKTRRALVPPPIYVAGEIIRELRKALENKQGAINHGGKYSSEAC